MHGTRAGIHLIVFALNPVTVYKTNLLTIRRPGGVVVTMPNKLFEIKYRNQENGKLKVPGTVPVNGE